MAQPTLTQADCAFYNDGTESGSTLISGTNITVGNTGTCDKAFDTTILIRAVIQTTGKALDSVILGIRASKNGGAYDTLGNITGITAINSANLTQYDDTTQRLGSGTFQSDNDGVGDNSLTGSKTYNLNEETEVLFSFEIDEADVSDADYFDFRVYFSDGSALDTYSETLRVTVDKATGTTYNQSAAGTITPAGAISKKGNKPLAGAISFTGTIAKAVNKTYAGAITFAGDLVKKTSKSFAGAITPSGVVGTAKKVLRTLAGAMSFSGDLSKQANKSFSGAMSFTGEISNKAKKALSGAATFVGNVYKKTAHTLAGAITPSGAVDGIKKVVKVLAGSMSFSGGLAKKTIKPLAGAITFAGNVYKKMSLTLAGAVSFSGAITKKARKALAGAVSYAGALVTNLIEGVELVAVVDLTLALRDLAVSLKDRFLSPTLAERDRDLTLKDK